MNTSTSFGHETLHLQDNGTVKDLITGNIWLAAPYGMHFVKGEWKGEPKFLDWHQATSLFGKANTVYEKPKNESYKMGNIVNASAPLSYQEYTKGNSLFNFGGVNDWRLPTLHEVVCLLRYQTYSRYLATQNIKPEDSRKYYALIERTFSSFVPGEENTNIHKWTSWWSDVWVANGALKQFIAFGKVKVAWSVNFSGGKCSCAIDQPTSYKCSLLLISG